MATSGEAFAITVGLYSVVLVCIFVLFSVWRRLRITRKFYAPKRLHPEADHACPPPLSRSFGKWVHRVWRVGEGEVVAIAGVDAAMYLKVLRLGEWRGLTACSDSTPKDEATAVHARADYNAPPCPISHACCLLSVKGAPLPI